jgi:hypothetical protein
VPAVPFHVEHAHRREAAKQVSGAKGPRREDSPAGAFVERGAVTCATTAAHRRPPTTARRHSSRLAKAAPLRRARSSPEARRTRGSPVQPRLDLGRNCGNGSALSLPRRSAEPSLRDGPRHPHCRRASRLRSPEQRAVRRPLGGRRYETREPCRTGQQPPSRRTVDAGRERLVAVRPTNSIVFRDP